MCNEAAFSNLLYQKVEASDAQQKKQEVEGIDGVINRVRALWIAGLGRIRRRQVQQGPDPPDGSPQKWERSGEGQTTHLWNIAL